MAKDFQIINDIPINLTAARVIGSGTHYEGRYTRTAPRLEAPLPTIPTPPGNEDFSGQVRGDLIVIGYVGKGRWLVKCRCGYYTTRKTRFLKTNWGDWCEDCDYRDYVKRRYAYERTGVWQERKWAKREYSKSKGD